MLYSGHFSFDELTTAGQEGHGYFTCLVKAGTPELALQKFRQRIQTIRDEIQAPLFKNIQAVYVEDIVEIADTPDEAVVTRFQSSDGPFPRSRSCSLPTSDTKIIKAYQWIPESASDTGKKQTDQDQEYKEAVPFMQFSE
ncbi:MAG: hypothetical protein R6V15_16985 [Desulfotignum sp.]